MSPINKLKDFLESYAKGKLAIKEMPSIACELLEQGLDTPSLRILAGLNKQEDSDTIQRYLKDTAAELHIDVPEYVRDMSFYILLGLEVAEEIVAGKREIYTGVGELIEELNSYNFFQESKSYVYDSIGFEKVYSLYYSFDDLPCNSPLSWEHDPSLTKQVNELKQELLKALKLWIATTKKDS